MDGDLEVVVARSGGDIEVSVSGEIDIATVDRFRRAIRDAIYEAQGSVKVNLLEVRFIASVGINALVGARQLALDEQVDLRIVKMSRIVERVLEVMGMAGYFD